MVRTGFEPATYGFQIRRSNHSATLPPLMMIMMKFQNYSCKLYLYYSVTNIRRSNHSATLPPLMMIMMKFPNYSCKLYLYYSVTNKITAILHSIITLIIFPPGSNISVVSGCLLKGSVSEFNKWRMMTALSIILPLVGRITGSCMSVIISGSVKCKRNIYNYKPL